MTSAARVMMVAVIGGFGLQSDTVAQQGKSIFQGKGNCFTCHGANAKGTELAPDLTDAEWLNIDGSRASIRNLVRNGVAKPKKYPAPMPPMGGAKLSDAELDAVAAYVASLQGESALDARRRSRSRRH